MKRRFMVHHPLVVDVGCGCRQSKLSTLFSVSSSSSSLKKWISKSASSTSPSLKPSTSQEESSADGTATISSFSSSFEDPSSPSSVKQEEIDQNGEKQSPAVKRRNRRRKQRVVEESVAVVKESSNPYLDFRESLVAMIVEKEIYGWDDLCDLLHRFLSLNSSGHHHEILRAFADVLNSILLPEAEVTGV